jgi:hypothetical protein
MGEVWHPFSPRGLCLKMAICLTMERVASQVKGFASKWQFASQWRELPHKSS